MRAADFQCEDPQGDETQPADLDPRKRLVEKGNAQERDRSDTYRRPDAVGDAQREGSLNRETQQGKGDDIPGEESRDEWRPGEALRGAETEGRDDLSTDGAREQQVGGDDRFSPRREGCCG